MQDKDIVTYHGRSFIEYPIDYYSVSESNKYRCLENVKDNVNVDIGGTGVMAFHTDKFKPQMEVFKYPNMADVLLSSYAKQQGKTITCLSHKQDYFKYQQVKNTIYEQKLNDCQIETDIVNQNFK